MIVFDMEEGKNISLKYHGRRAIKSISDVINWKEIGESNVKYQRGQQSIHKVNIRMNRLGIQKFSGISI